MGVFKLILKMWFDIAYDNIFHRIQQLHRSDYSLFYQQWMTFLKSYPKEQLFEEMYKIPWVLNLFLTLWVISQINYNIAKTML